MLNTPHAVELLRFSWLAPKTLIFTPRGLGRVMFQLGDTVTAIIGGRWVVDVPRAECEEVCQ